MWRRLLLGALLAGCAHPSGPSPVSLVRTYLAAGDHPHAAYRLLSRTVRSTIPEDEFVARWRAQAEERKSQGATLAAITIHPPTERARASWPTGRELELAHESGGWRVVAPRATTGGAPSPEDAVQRFAEALERHDLDGLLDLMADPLRSLVERELADRLARLKSSAHKEIRVEGERARIRYDDHYYLELRREDGRWKVSDFN